MPAQSTLTVSGSLVRNIIPLTKAPPRPVVTWDKHERIRRNKEIWDNPESVVHRLPKHYQERYWKLHVLADRTPVHYRPPESRFYWDQKRLVQIETEHVPILPLHCPEQDQGLWGGEGVLKSYTEGPAKLKKKVLPRNWMPTFYFPKISRHILYSEVLDAHMRVVVTERALRHIDAAYGLDYYLLSTPEMDLGSQLALDLKRLILIKLAKGDYHLGDEERKRYIKEKYAEFTLPMEEAEWVGLDLNTACKKQQDLEDDTQPVPLKYLYEKQLVKELDQVALGELEDETKPQPSVIPGVEKLHSRVMGIMTKKMRPLKY